MWIYLPIHHRWIVPSAMALFVVRIGDCSKYVSHRSDSRSCLFSISIEIHLTPCATTWFNYNAGIGGNFLTETRFQPFRKSVVHECMPIVNRAGRNASRFLSDVRMFCPIISLNANIAAYTDINVEWLNRALQASTRWFATCIGRTSCRNIDISANDWNGVLVVLGLITVNLVNPKKLSVNCNFFQNSEFCLLTS